MNTLLPGVFMCPAELYSLSAGKPEGRECPVTLFRQGDCPLALLMRLSYADAQFLQWTLPAARFEKLTTEKLTVNLSHHAKS